METSKCLLRLPTLRYKLLTHIRSCCLIAMLTVTFDRFLYTLKNTHSAAHPQHVYLFSRETLWPSNMSTGNASNWPGKCCLNWNMWVYEETFKGPFISYSSDCIKSRISSKFKIIWNKIRLYINRIFINTVNTCKLPGKFTPVFLSVHYFLSPLVFRWGMCRMIIWPALLEHALSHLISALWQSTAHEEACRYLLSSLCTPQL